MNWSERIVKLYDTLSFLDYSEQRENGFPSSVEKTKLTSSDIVMKGIADLDFDWCYFLATGKITPDTTTQTK